MQQFEDTKRRLREVSEGSRVDSGLFNGAVVVHHQDGSHFFFNNAFVWTPPEVVTASAAWDAALEAAGDAPFDDFLKLASSDPRDDWPFVCIVSEHCGEHVFFKDDLSHWESLGGKV